MVSAIIWFILIVDTITSILSTYLFVWAYLLPIIKHRHTKKNGVYATFTLYEQGEYRGTISLNISEIIGMLLSALIPEKKEVDKNEKH
jgi:hypothetical protein